MSSSVHIDNTKKINSWKRSDTRIEKAFTAEKIYSINFSATKRALFEPAL